MRLSRWHLIVWLAMGLVAATFAVRACFLYNHFAATDKSPRHIAVIATAVMTGPMVGPIANPGGLGDGAWLGAWTGVLLGGLILSLCPYLFVRRKVTSLVYWLTWCGYTTMSLIWFTSSLVSLGHFLS